MRSGSATDGRGEHESNGRSTNDAIESHLHAALDEAEDRDTRYHLRQALQLARALDGGE